MGLRLKPSFASYKNRCTLLVHDSYGVNDEARCVGDPDHCGCGGGLANFARIPAEIDGETIDFLFDTGATNILPEEVLKQIGDGRPANRATSFLTRSTFEKWRSKHPEWRSFDNIRTLSGKAMIEVPRVTVGGFTVGPVWFTVQSDSAFHTYMAQWMDKQTEGALGGSLLHYLRVSVDWPNAVAVFEKP